MARELLIDSMPIRLELDEAKSGKVIARGEFARCDVPTQNGRSYPRGIYEREVKRLSETIGSRRAFGELDHPADGKTKLTRASHLITNLTIEDDGRVIGEAEILDTPAGRTLKAILSANAEVGISSRGFGSTRPGDDGGQVVGEDFVLRTFDFVADPAMKTAYPGIFAEDVEEENFFTYENIKAEFPELVNEIVQAVSSHEPKASDGVEEDIRETEQAQVQARAEELVQSMLEQHSDKIRGEMTEGFERKLAESVIGLRDSITEQLKEEYDNDPSIGGARGVLESIAGLVSQYNAGDDEVAALDAIRAKDLEISKLRSECDEAAGLAKSAGYQLYVERAVADHPLASTIRSVMKDVNEFGSIEELKVRLDAVMDELAEVAEEKRIQMNKDDSSKIAAFESESEKLGESVSSLEGEVSELRSRLTRAVEIGETLQEQLADAKADAKQSLIEAYKWKRAGGHSNSSKLMSLLEGVEDEGAIDRIVSGSGTHKMSDSSLEDLRSRLRRGTTRETIEALEEESPSPLPRGAVIGGVDLNKMRQLAGIS